MYVSPVKYELGFYIPEDDILHSHRRENPKSCMCLASLRVLQNELSECVHIRTSLYRQGNYGRNMSPAAGLLPVWPVAFCSACRLFRACVRAVTILHMFQLFKDHPRACN
jgi:hypothetical protein